MNQRQKLKKLKNDNKLMHRTINDMPEMKELYENFNAPIKNVVRTTVPIEHICSRCDAPRDIQLDGAMVDYLKEKIKHELFKGIEQFISFEIDEVFGRTQITGHLFVGRKKEETYSKRINLTNFM